MSDLSSLPSFPCRADKRPITTHGFKDARVHSTTRGWPLRGIPTGAASGLTVLDIDPAGVSWFNEVPLPATRTHVTRRGGLHLLFKHVPGLRNSSGKVAEGVDIRGEGGYFIDWSREGFDVMWPDLVVEFPGWVLRGLPVGTPKNIKASSGGSTGVLDTPVGTINPSGGSTSLGVPTSPHYPSPTRDVKGRSYYHLNRLERQAVGGRTAMLFEVACQFAEMIAEGRITPKIATTLMLQACQKNGLIKEYGEAEILRQIGNAYNIIGERGL
jgi:hypothetical protein